MNRCRGFTLLEVMVAAAILAVGLTAVVGAIGMAVRSAALAAGYEQARLVAEAQLALFLAEEPRRPERRSGNADGLTWRLRAEHPRDRDGDEDQNLLGVVVEVDFFAPGGLRTVGLETRQVLRQLPEADLKLHESGAGPPAGQRGGDG